MPSRARGKQAVYNTPTIRNGGFGYLQVEAIHNRPMSIARRHLAASELRMRSIEPSELSSSEWVRFLVMETPERDRWIAEFERRRRNSNSSSSSAEGGLSKEEEARLEAVEAARGTAAEAAPVALPSVAAASPAGARTGVTPSVSVWARRFDGNESGQYSARRPRHARRAVTESLIDAPAPPPTYETAVRSRSPPPAYEPRSDDEGSVSPRHIRFAV
ncbi:hypothetical protein BDY17DRAFT_326014 [Neohortaea acidophila]|uniref:Uncharacterized protein n=1 Tax=Neohortaea acidophila TaxID=245834 RepID=A0A6A6PPE8_9PEZI|nr:uncharacterized protein BDY17DRAFT_326014 [Neohortaea acidophila]KAF2481313.1 hypothetical protein BDY17DRAFT_326014 [Neohortaea acidophila]